MNQHIETLIDAYLDGELSVKQSKNVESHIKNCPECLVQLEKRQQLSGLLRAVPGYASDKSSEQFVREVNLLLPRQQKKPARLLSNLIWISIPFALLAAFIFIQSLSLVSGALWLFPGANEFLVNSITGSGGGLHLIPWLQTLVEGAMIWSGVEWLFDWSWVTYILSMVIIGILYLLWLAGWLVSKGHFISQES